jgi:hypothetical protein
MEFNSDHFLAARAPELSKDNSNSKREVTKEELIMHMDNSMCDNGRRIKGYVTRRKMARTPIQFINRPVNV